MIDKKLLHVQYMSKPAGKLANVNKKISGNNFITWACTGSATVLPLTFCCKNILIDIKAGQIPICKKLGKVIGIRPNRVKIDTGSAADKSLIQPKNGACLISIVTYSTL